MIYIFRYFNIRIRYFCLYFMIAESLLPEGFSFLKDINPTIIQNLRYSSTDNFMGRCVHNYSHMKLACTTKTAQGLNRIQKNLQKQGYSLVVYDAYRPASATQSFMEWCTDLSDVDQRSKQFYYPFIEKKDIVPSGYIAKKSGHNRGSTVDLSIIKIGEKLKPIESRVQKLKDGTQMHVPDDNTMYMGTGFDLFHKASHHGSQLVSQQATKNRQFLCKQMEKQGFKKYPCQWWHYTLVEEPFPQTYFDFHFENFQGK